MVLMNCRVCYKLEATSHFLLVVFPFVKYRSGEYARTAYVTFKDAYALETAILLSVSISKRL